MLEVKPFLTRSMRATWGVGLLCAGVALSPNSAVAQKTLSEAFKKQVVELEQPNEIVAADLFNSITPEIIATDVRGNIMVFNAENGQPILRAKDALEKAFTGPVVADFLDDNTLDIGVGTEDGRVLIFDGSTLSVISERQIAQATFSVLPTLVTLPDPEDASRTVEVIVLIDQNGVIHSAYPHPRTHTILSYWEPITSGTKASAPATVGHVRSRNQLDIVIPASDGNLVFVDPQAGSMKKMLIAEGKPIETTVLMIDVDEDGLDEMVYTMKNGEVHVSYYDVENDRVEDHRVFATGNAPIGDPVLVNTMKTPVREGLIFQGGKNTVFAFKISDPNPANWDEIPGDKSEFGGFNTPISVVPSESGNPLVAFGVNRIVCLVDTSDWFAERPTVKNSIYAVDEDLTNTVVSVTLPVDGKNQACLVGLSPTGRLFSIQTNRLPIATTTYPWMTRGGTPKHSGFVDLNYHGQDLQRRMALDKLVAEKIANRDEATNSGRYAEALAAADWLSKHDPLSQEFKSEYQRIWLKKNLWWLALSVIAVVLFVGYIGLLILRLILRRNLERRAKAAVAAEKFDEAETLYEKLRTKMPKTPRIVATLAMVYVSKGNTEEKTIEVYQKALEQEPDKQNILHAYARALIRAEKTDAEAVEIYTKALKSNFPEPALMEYGLGMCHKASGKLEEAGKCLRAALRGGLTSNNVYSALCDIYLTTNNRSAKTLPVYQHQFASRQLDQKFIEAYLDACIDSKQCDGTVESLSYQVLEGNPKYVPAYCHLASMHLQKGETGAAIEDVKRALEHEPTNQTATVLLAHCYLIESRKDEMAQKAYTNALAIVPDNQEILTTLADIYFRQGRYDSEAIKIYHRSHQEAPDDVTTLKALAETAKLSANHDLSVKVIENLVIQGQTEAKHMMQLARAYVAKGVYESKAEKIYREALRQEPTDRELTAALAKVYVLLHREDLEVIPTLETQYRFDPKDRNAGCQLAKAYVKANRYPDALRVSQSLSRDFPDDPEIKNLVALSSLYDNKIDDAVAEYTQILTRNPNDRQAEVHLAMAYAQKGKVDDEAAKLYQRAMETQGANPDLHMAMARVHLTRNDSVKAVECYQKVLKILPGSEEHLIRHITGLLNEFPDAIRVRWFLCEVLVAYGHLREALEQLNTVYDTNPNQAKNILGALEKILSKDPKNISAMTTKGQILAATDSLPEARAVLEAAYKLQPSNADVTRLLSNVYESTLKKKEDAEVRFRLGRIHYMNQDFDKAIGAFQKTAQDYRWEAESTKMLGKCFTAKGMLDLALQEFKKLVVDDETKELLYDLAQRYESKKDLVGAKTVYRQLFAADIDYKDVRTRFEMLSGSTSDPVAFEKTSIVQAMSEDAKRRYELLDELGRGAMGIVYRARDKELEEVVALKILPDSMSNNPEAVRRFKIEARNARKVSHPNIVRIHDIGEEMGRKYISMEYVDGSDLKKKLRTSGKFDQKDFFRYGIQIADALAYAHRLGIVHRDIKPANIMLTSSDDVKVTDFGIAKMLDSTAAEGTMVGAVIGTPLYMSPEQVQGIPVDNRADIYAYGIMLYEFINGRPPFTEGDLAYQHIHREPTPPEGCPDEIWQVIKKCLEKDKEQRWSTAEDIVEELKAAQKKLATA